MHIHIMYTYGFGIHKVEPKRDVPDLDLPDAEFQIRAEGSDEPIKFVKSTVESTDKDGKSVSYEPKRYEYRYDFYITAYVKNPYFDTLRFKINRSYVTIDPYAEGEAREAKLKAEAPQQTIVTHRQTQYGFGVSAPQATVVSVAPDIHVDRYTPDTENNEDYQTYKKMAEEIVAVLSEQ